MYVWVCMPLSDGTLGGQKGVANPPVLELEVVVSCLDTIAGKVNLDPLKDCVLKLSSGEPNSGPQVLN